MDMNLTVVICRPQAHKKLASVLLHMYSTCQKKALIPSMNMGQTVTSIGTLKYFIPG